VADGAVAPLIPTGRGESKAANLRSAVAGANALSGDDTILLDAGTSQLNSDLLRGPLTISDPSGGQLTIQGPAGALSTIDPLQLSRIFNVDPGNTATLTALQLQNGRDTSGAGGAIPNQGNLTTNGGALINHQGLPPQR